jgi:hypothetical protein
MTATSMPKMMIVQYSRIFQGRDSFCLAALRDFDLIATSHHDDGEFEDGEADQHNDVGLPVGGHR